MFLAPMATNEILNNAYDFIATNLGSSYLIMGLATLAFLLILAVSKFGKIKLGLSDEEPEYGTSVSYTHLTLPTTPYV